MDTPIIAQYYRETEPEKRKELLEQAIASGEDQEANKIRKEIWEARYKGTTNEGGIADGYLKFWMALELIEMQVTKYLAPEEHRRKYAKNWMM